MARRSVYEGELSGTELMNNCCSSEQRPVARGKVCGNCVTRRADEQIDGYRALRLRQHAEYSALESCFAIIIMH